MLSDTSRAIKALQNVIYSDRDSQESMKAERERKAGREREGERER